MLHSFATDLVDSNYLEDESNTAQSLAAVHFAASYGEIDFQQPTALNDQSTRSTIIFNGFYSKASTFYFEGIKIPPKHCMR